MDIRQLFKIKAQDNSVYEVSPFSVPGMKFPFELK